MSTHIVKTVANPHASGNIGHGELVFKSGITDPVEVYKAHLWWARGAAAEYHFANGYRKAAEQAGASIGTALDLFEWNADKELIRKLWADRLTYPCPYNHAKIKELEQG